ncbi:SgcJ/EcaC family oxidoreductase [Actinomycetospora endophytica]|uniref:SgcJ/EcaC family oxidoreductase n=1 Tax=Actinomycetospora endophytica TaxID=2291215 RepID=A0ABS8P131_9PSEU|nr:SgcJ/EcaC family oxidoreductase [Actinomycetospora endophytica]MCD2191967.1 SgcJ/EcaC family oxidoreductase [Actinomycetospora endophytica]
MTETIREGAARDDVQARNRQFMDAFAAGDAARVASLYTEDAVVLPPDAPMITGRAHVEEFWRGLMNAGVREVGLETLRLDGSAELLHEIGRATITVRPADGETMTQLAKYVVVWERKPAGEWQLAVDIWNAQPT